MRRFSSACSTASAVTCSALLRLLDAEPGLPHLQHDQRLDVGTLLLGRTAIALERRGPLARLAAVEQRPLHADARHRHGLVVEELVLEVVVAAGDADLRQHAGALDLGHLAVRLRLLAERLEFGALLDRQLRPAPPGPSAAPPGPAAPRRARPRGRAARRGGGCRPACAISAPLAARRRFCRASASATCTASRSFFGTSSRSNIAPMSPTSASSVRTLLSATASALRARSTSTYDSATASSQVLLRATRLRARAAAARLGRRDARGDPSAGEHRHAERRGTHREVVAAEQCRRDDRQAGERRSRRPASRRARCRRRRPRASASAARGRPRRRARRPRPGCARRRGRGPAARPAPTPPSASPPRPRVQRPPTRRPPPR